MLNADPSVVSSRAKKRGLPQLGTLGAGNHYAEIQVRRSEKTPFIHMERTYHILTAILGCRRDLWQICSQQDGDWGKGPGVKIGSEDFWPSSWCEGGAHDPLWVKRVWSPSCHGRTSLHGEGHEERQHWGKNITEELEVLSSSKCLEVNDRQLACARIDSKEGREYLSGMAAAANFAWVNRSSMTFLARQVKIRDCDCKCFLASI